MNIYVFVCFIVFVIKSKIDIFDGFWLIVDILQKY